MKKLISYVMVVSVFMTMNACNNNDDNPQKGMQDAVDALIASGGNLQTAVAKSEEKLISRDTLPQTTYKDPVAEYQYDAYPIKTVKHHSMTDNPMEFVTLDPWDMLWPGALIQGASIRNGVPSSIPIYSKRLPGRIYLDIVSGADMDDWYKEVPMRGSDVTQAMNQLLKTYLGSGIPARTSFEIKTVSSVEELALKFGINLSLFGGKLKSEFGNSWNKEKTYVAVKLNQIFFSMRYDGPDGGFKGTFTDDITTDDLKNYTGPGNPLCYVSSVSYGRSFILLYESDRSSREMEFALNVAYKVVDVTSAVTQRNIINSSSCKMVQIGGDPQAGLETVFGDFSKIRDFVLNGATVSAANVGAPISYKIVHLHDNSPARLSNTLEYDVTTTEYVAVYPNNDVVIDLFTIKMPKPSTERKLSNYSYMQLKELWVSHGPTGNETLRKKVIDFEKDKQGTNIEAFNLPIYNTYVLESVPKNHRICIHCTFDIYNQTYGWPTKTGSKTITLVHLFEYNQSLNKWQPVEKNVGTPFESLSIQRDLIGDAWTEFSLNYRFMCDGRIYTYSEDGAR